MDDQFKSDNESYDPDIQVLKEMDSDEFEDNSENKIYKWLIFSILLVIILSLISN